MWQKHQLSEGDKSHLLCECRLSFTILIYFIFPPVYNASQGFLYQKSCILGPVYTSAFSF